MIETHTTGIDGCGLYGEQQSALEITNQLNRQIAALPEPDRLAVLGRLLAREGARIRALEGLEPKDKPTLLEEGVVYAADRTLEDDEAPPEAWIRVCTGIIAIRLLRSHPEYSEELLDHTGALRLLRQLFPSVQVTG